MKGCGHDPSRPGCVVCEYEHWLAAGEENRRIEFRDQCAIHAMAALLQSTSFKPEEVAGLAYNYALAMVKVRDEL